MRSQLSDGRQGIGPNDLTGDVHANHAFCVLIQREEVSTRPDFQRPRPIPADLVIAGESAQLGERLAQWVRDVDRFREMRVGSREHAVGPRGNARDRVCGRRAKFLRTVAADSKNVAPLIIDARYVNVAVLSDS